MTTSKELLKLEQGTPLHGRFTCNTGLSGGTLFGALSSVVNGLQRFGCGCATRHPAQELLLAEVKGL